MKSESGVNMGISTWLYDTATLGKDAHERDFRTLFWTPEVTEAVRSTASKFKIDGRAIVGVIWWELKHNYYRGTLTDGIQGLVASFGYQLGNGIGWGSMHFDTAASLSSTYPDDVVIGVCTASTQLIAACLAEAELAIHLIGAEMGRAADVYSVTAGVNIRSRPEILAVLYHTGNVETKAADLAKRIQEAISKGETPPQPQVGEDKMGTFVRDKLGELMQFAPLGVTDLKSSGNIG